MLCNQTEAAAGRAGREGLSSRELRMGDVKQEQALRSHLPATEQGLLADQGQSCPECCLQCCLPECYPVGSFFLCGDQTLGYPSSDTF